MPLRTRPTWCATGRESRTRPRVAGSLPRPLATRFASGVRSHAQVVAERERGVDVLQDGSDEGDGADEALPQRTARHS